MTPTLEDAISLAANAHRGQLDKIGEPYILHPLRVMLRFDDPAKRMAAVLHDVVEDSDTSLADLREMGYPVEVVGAVDHLTRREGETYPDFIERCKANPMARAVKLADLEDNLDPARVERLEPQDKQRLERYHQAKLILDDSDGV